MKFVELKSKLDREVFPVYVIQGDDRFVCLNAQNIFEKRFALNYPDINRIVFDESVTMQEIISGAMVFPMGDDYRFIEIRDFKTQHEKQDIKLLEEYIKDPSDQTVILFINSKESNFFNNISKKVEVVDCNRLEEKWVVACIKQNV